MTASVSGWGFTKRFDAFPEKPQHGHWRKARARTDMDTGGLRTEEVSVEILVLCIGQALGGGTLLLLSQLPAVWVDRGKDHNPRSVNQLHNGQNAERKHG